MKTLRLAWRALLMIGGLFILYMAILRLIRRHFHFPAPAFVGRFLDSDLRRKLQPPEHIIARSGVRSGMKVLEIGCGSGAYTTFVARAVGERGEVAALDVQPAMLKQLEAKLRRPENRDLQNIRLYEHSAYDLPFEDGTFDLVYMITVLPEIPEPRRALREAHRVLKPGGILAVTEFLPDPDYPLASTTVERGRQAGLVPEAILGNLWSYTVRFKKSSL